MIDGFVERCFNELLSDESNKEKITEKFLQKFKNLSEEFSAAKRWNTACRIVAKRLVHDNLNLRKKLVGELLKAIRSISQQSISTDSFEEGSHTVSSEPYYRETSYKSPALKEITIVDRENKCLITKIKSHIDKDEFSLEGIIIAVDTKGRCHLRLQDKKDTTEVPTEVSPKIWKCDVTCKTFCN